MIRIKTLALLQFSDSDVLLNYKPHNKQKFAAIAASANNAQSFNVEEVTTDLRRVKYNKSTGPDCILKKLLNVWAYALGQPLCGLFNQIVMQGEFPL